MVEKGECVAIMGPSGSGKSTLLHLLGGLDQPSDREVTLAGQRLSILNDRRATLVRRYNAGFAFPFFNLVPTLTTQDDAALTLCSHHEAPERESRADSILALAGAFFMAGRF